MTEPPVILAVYIMVGFFYALQLAFGFLWYLYEHLTPSLSST